MQYRHKKTPKLHQEQEARDILELYNQYRAPLIINDDIAFFDAETSGSTGFPKKIHIRKDYAIASAQKTIEFFHLQPHSKLHLCMHAKYIGAKMMILRALACGMELTYSEPTMDALAAIDLRVDFCACVPLQLIDLLHQKPQGNPLIACLIIGGAPLDQVWKLQLILWL